MPIRRRRQTSLRRGVASGHVRRAALVAGSPRRPIRNPVARCCAVVPSARLRRRRRLRFHGDGPGRALRHHRRAVDARRASRGGGHLRRCREVWGGGKKKRSAASREWRDTRGAARAVTRDPDRVSGVPKPSWNRSAIARAPGGCAARRHLASVSRGDFSHESATCDGFVPSRFPSSPSWGSRGLTSRRRKWAFVRALTGVESAIKCYRHSVATRDGVVSRAFRARRAASVLRGCL